MFQAIQTIEGVLGVKVPIEKVLPLVGCFSKKSVDFTPSDVVALLRVINVDAKEDDPGVVAVCDSVRSGDFNPVWATMSRDDIVVQIVKYFIRKEQ